MCSGLCSVCNNSHQQELLSAASGTQYVPLDHDMLQGVTQPRSKPEVAPATFGFVERAERWNSRACMVTAIMTFTLLHALAVSSILHNLILARLLLQIGFFALLIVEFVANKGLLDMLGFRIGSGLPFEI